MQPQPTTNKIISTIAITAILCLSCPIATNAFIGHNNNIPTRGIHSIRNGISTIPSTVNDVSSTERTTSKINRYATQQQQQNAYSKTCLFSTNDDNNNEEENTPNNTPSSSQLEESNILSKFDLPNTVFLIGGQATLILIAALLSFPLHQPNYGLGANFSLSPTNLGLGALATTPLIAIAFLLDFVEDKVPALRDTTFATYRSVLVVMGSQRRPLVALVVATALGLAAGFGEEMLFRGVLQTYLMDNTSNLYVSVGLSSVLFGLLHLATPLYAIIATLASSYFGYLFLAFGSGGTNLAVPIICHGLYDVWALCWAHYVITGMTREEQLDIWNWTGPGSLSSYGNEDKKQIED
uniref:CAAX prenyl protease 2/Lysostaphin resistance protein A-like domain-containing protein n=1 Tax=Ditylum brightwellii TaxID=49249 RepID=A0A7S1YXI1_9STRA|mmetsp:Transcript_19847/g.29597  ORF Transcript_19847/g.29597 Transcript_19847/m.29597 type:complete len:352 (+) Transcript_19847:151-1206(+)